MQCTRFPSRHQISFQAYCSTLSIVVHNVLASSYVGTMIVELHQSGQRRVLPMRGRLMLASNQPRRSLAAASNDNALILQRTTDIGLIT